MGYVGWITTACFGADVKHFPEVTSMQGIAIDFIQLGIYNIAQIMRRVETLSNSVPGLAFIGLRPVYLLNLETAEVPMSGSSSVPMHVHSSVRRLGRRLQVVFQSHEITRMSMEDRRF